MVVFTFSALDWKHPFRANLVQQIKIIFLSWNLVPWLIRICRIQWWCSLFLFYTGNTLFYCLCDRTGVETLKYAAVVSKAFLFCCGECPGNKLYELNKRVNTYSCFAVLKNQKQPLADILQNRCSQKFRNIQRKTPVLESLFRSLFNRSLFNNQVCNFPVKIEDF